MNKLTITLSLFIVFVFFSTSSFAWNKKGHQMVAQVAMHFLDDTTKMKVKKNLGKMSFEDAATWMDDMRADKFYDFMRPWHYINIDKGQEYKPLPERDIVTVLHSVIKELRQKQTLKKERIKTDLCVLFHTIGDLHQPLHVGYGVDRGGNDALLSFKGYNSNLHGVWDYEIIETENITLEDCLEQFNYLSKLQVDSIQTISVMQWTNQSRALLPAVYNYQNNKIDQAYIVANTPVIKKQILIAGLRLAAVLKELYKN